MPSALSRASVRKVEGIENRGPRGLMPAQLIES
jgi:hypothetical protein